MPARICVVGSINMDLVVGAERFPEPGETLIGGRFRTAPGGKGANQAVAAARMGASVAMVGCVGDPYGEELIGVLEADGVDVSGVTRLHDVPSGVGMITVVPGGENAIVVASGANARLSAEQVIDHRTAVESADVLILQLETTSAANEAALQMAAKGGTRTILNAAPAKPLPYRLLDKIDLLVVNRVEAEMLCGRDALATHDELLAGLAELGAKEIVLTLGPQGAMHARGGKSIYQGSFPVLPEDTTACGDAFVGAYAVAFAEDAPAEVALRTACAAGGLAAATAGAIPSLPDRAAVEELLSGKQ